jgi:hypothetical protein
MEFFSIPKRYAIYSKTSRGFYDGVGFTLNRSAVKIFSSRAAAVKASKKIAKWMYTEVKAVR